MIFKENVSVNQITGYGLRTNYSYDADLRAATSPHYEGVRMPDWMFHWAKVHGVRPDNDNLDEGQQGQP